MEIVIVSFSTNIGTYENILLPELILKIFMNFIKVYPTEILFDNVPLSNIKMKKITGAQRIQAFTLLNADLPMASLNFADLLFAALVQNVSHKNASATNEPVPWLANVRTILPTSKASLLNQTEYEIILLSNKCLKLDKISKKI